MPPAKKLRKSATKRDQLVGSTSPAGPLFSRCTIERSSIVRPRSELKVDEVDWCTAANLEHAEHREQRRHHRERWPRRKHVILQLMRRWHERADERSRQQQRLLLQDAANAFEASK